MNARNARRWYVSGLFLLLMSNGISGVAASLGVRGIAFYHVQALVLLLCIGQAAVLAISGRVELKIDPLFFTVFIGSLLYTVVSGLLLLRFSDVVPGYVALILHKLLFYPTAALLMLGCGRVGDDGAFDTGLPKWMRWATTAVILFGWLQFVVKDPILEVTNSENVSKLVQASTMGTFRPPSVFESSFQFGLFSLLVFCLAIAYAEAGNRGAWPLAILGLSGVALSQTRNVFLCAGWTAASFFLLMKVKRRRNGLGILRVAPVLYAIATVGVMAYAVWGFLQSGLEKSGDLADASSSWARVSSWQRAWETLVQSGSAFDFLLGYGITQAGHASDYRSLYPSRGEGLFIDSTFVNIFLLQGIVALVVFLIVWWLTWERLLQRVREDWDPLSVGVTVFFSAFLAAGVFNILNGQWWGITISLAMVVLTNKGKAGSTNAQRRTHYRSLPNCC